MNLTEQLIEFCTNPFVLSASLACISMWIMPRVLTSIVHNMYKSERFYPINFIDLDTATNEVLEHDTQPLPAISFDEITGRLQK